MPRRKGSGTSHPFCSPIVACTFRGVHLWSLPERSDGVGEKALGWARGTSRLGKQGRQVFQGFRHRRNWMKGDSDWTSDSCVWGWTCENFL
ncbi:uncharacterized protein BDR25DRAFT_126830 [Lindgomyces ingoldianus]|uniref:Uncharacterized protein n=1 Tax=Lindgomyces ingoldianus TaxID=673940 RepID=A0ACB6R406_9PLEO|nr:uncharacterized protein BDR25DRAFT_126830 [Lindgomyces ingoldianus]KAF2473984.1 hypothetical protein BDR25DRAFT_126830 [Lindgomyces ingoldianus]